jgi:seryl-tRNA synthetase
MHDIKPIRDNPAAFDAALGRRGLSPLSPQILALDAARRETLTTAQAIQTERNQLSKEIGARKQKGEDASDILAAVAKSKDAQAAAEAKAGEEQAALDTMLATIPNLPADDVPVGKDEHDNVERHKQGEPAKFDFKAKEHADLGMALASSCCRASSRVSNARSASSCSICRRATSTATAKCVRPCWSATMPCSAPANCRSSPTTCSRPRPIYG